jgi:hypothetical protein
MARISTYADFNAIFAAGSQPGELDDISHVLMDTKFKMTSHLVCRSGCILHAAHQAGMMGEWLSSIAMKSGDFTPTVAPI